MLRHVDLQDSNAQDPALHIADALGDGQAQATFQRRRGLALIRPLVAPVSRRRTLQ